MSMKEIDLDPDLVGDTTELVLKGETTAIIQKPDVAANLQKIFASTSIKIQFYKKMNPELIKFCGGGTGALFADTYGGLEAVRYVSERNNNRIPVIFLVDPKDTFFDAEKLKTLGPRVIGVYDEILTMDVFIEIVKLANKGYFDQEVTLIKTGKK